MPDEENRKSGFLTFWTTLPGILTGLAALITAVIGAIALFKTTDNGKNGESVGAGTPVTISVSQGSEPSSGRLPLRRGDSADLEHGQVGQPANPDLIFGDETTPTLHYTGSSSFAPVDGRPTKSRCVAALKSRSDPTEIVSDLETRWLCVSTSEGNVAVVRVVKAPGPGDARLLLAYSVWR